MARIRTIKPEFFTSADVVALSPLARLLFIGLWQIADREGRLKWRPADFKLQVLPGDECDIEALSEEIVSRGLIVRYGDGLAYIPTFLDHQSINPRETASKLPPPDASLTRAHASNPDLHPQRGREGKGKERNDSDPIGSGAVAPSQPDPLKALFDDGVDLLVSNGCKPSNARSVIGKWRQLHGEEATQAAIKAARAESITEPIAWITQRFAAKPRESWRDRQVREAEEAIDKALQ